MPLNLNSMNLKKHSLIFSITWILFLYVLSKLAQLPIIELHELPDYEGKEVTIKGIVTEQHQTRYGGQVISIEDQNSSAIIFVETKTDVGYGDRIQVTGEVQKYRDEWSVVVNDNRYVKILKNGIISLFPYGNLQKILQDILT